MSDLLLSVAPNGAYRTRRDHSAIPLTPAQIARDAEACRVAGAGLIHLHVRDEAGRHSLSPSIYRVVLEAVQAALGGEMIVQITTEAAGRYGTEEQMACVRAVRPPAASFALREFVPHRAAEPAASGFFAWVADAGILPQFILYTPEEALQLRDLVDRAVVPFGDPPVLFVLGRYGDGPPSDPGMIWPFVDAWGKDGHWSVCAFGPTELSVAATAISMGGHVRVGFENNLQRADGTPLRNNAEQVACVATLASEMRRPLTSAVPPRFRSGVGAV